MCRESRRSIVTSSSSSASISSQKHIECKLCGKKCPSKHDLEQHGLKQHKTNIQNKFKCDFCEKTFDRGSKLKVHRRTKHLNKRPFKCRICPKAFATNSCRIRHMKCHSTTSHKKIQPRKEKEKFRCAFCESHWPDKKSLEQHVENDACTEPSAKTEKEFECDICEGTFLSEHELERHSLQHEKKVREKKFKCDFCEKTWKDITSLNNHRRAIHLNEKPFKCQICPKSFATSRLRNEHMEQHHDSVQEMGIEKTYGCDFCGKSFRYKDDVDIHYRQVHLPCKCKICPRAFVADDERNRHMKKDHGLTKRKKDNKKKEIFGCEFCETTWPDKVSLEAHRNNVHLDEHICPTTKEDFECNICQGIFESESDLENHSFQHKKKRQRIPKFKCDFCEKMYTSRYALDIHCRGVHLNEKPFKCEICPKAYASTHGRNRHMKQHGVYYNEKRFICEYCEKHFGDKTALTTHIRIHLNERPFKCTICPKAYPAIGDLNTHMKRHSLPPKEKKKRKFNGIKKIYKCEFCDKILPDKTKLGNHRRGVHLNEKPFKCKICPKVFAASGKMRTHMKLHRKHGAYFCDTCNKVLTEKSVWLAHLERHEVDEEFQCEMCIIPTDSTILPSLCIKHQERHLFNCDICDETSTFHDHLKDHFKFKHLKSWRAPISR